MMRPLYTAETLNAAQVELDAHLDTLRALIRDETEALAAAAETAVAQPLVQTLREAAERHRTLLPVLSTDALPVPELLAIVQQYRTAVGVEVLAPLHEQVEALRLSATLTARFVAPLERGQAFAAELPERLVVPEPTELLAPNPADPFALRMRRARHRWGRGASDVPRRIGNALRRLFRGEPRPEPLFPHPVPLAALTQAHVEEAWTGLLSTAHEHAQREIANRIAATEVAVQAWTHALLRLDATLDATTLPPDPLGLADAATEAESHETAPLTALAQAFDEALDAASQPFDGLMPSLDLDGLDASLDAAVRASGTLRLGTRRTASTDPQRLTRAGERWQRWHAQAHERLTLARTLLDLRARMDAEQLTFLDRLAAEGLTPLFDTIKETQTVLRDLQAEAALACDEAEQSADPARALAPALLGLLRRADEQIVQRFLVPLQQARLDAAADRLARQAEPIRDREIKQVPPKLTLHLPAPPPVRPDVPPYTIEPRRIVAEVFGETFVEKMRGMGQRLRQPLFRVVSDAETVQQVVHFNLEAALDELERHPADRGEDEPDPIAAARELTVDGFARAAERLASLTEPLHEPWKTIHRDVDTLFAETWRVLHQRLEAADMGSGQLLDLREDMRARAEHAWRQTQAGAVALLKQLQQLARLGRRQAEQLITAGRTAAGLAAENERDRLEALDALAHLDALRARLPLVYRRLFSFQPVGDPLLLEQRDAALEAVRVAYHRWTDGQLASAILLTGPPGSGRTSILMALRRTLFADKNPAAFVLTRRIESESELAVLIGQALDLDPGPEPSLNRLEEILQAESERERICLIENLEHLLLRAPSGSDLYERMAVFLSRTDGVVFWVTTMVEPAWHFLLRTEPLIAALSQPIVLKPLDRSGLEAAVMKRHMRSGLPLVFAEPTDLQPLTRRRLKSAETEDTRQTILREVFFDRLFRASGGHLQLAFLHWLRTIDFEAVTDRLTVNPLQALDFSFIERFDLVRSFTLKALLQHGSLTLPEHDRVLRTTREESFLVFESLANELLIEQIVEPSGDGQMNRDTMGAPIASITPTDRYRIRPLVVNPVTEALRANNML